MNTRVVVTEEFLSQTGDIAATTLFTPAQDGLFRLSTYSDLTGAAGDEAHGGFEWTDDVKSHHENLSVGPSDQQEGGSRMVRCVAGQPIKYFTSTFLSAGQSYNAYAAIEQI
jgi:hypothetical protein